VRQAQKKQTPRRQAAGRHCGAAAPFVRLSPVKNTL
jgi:hypothetical protein